MSGDISLANYAGTLNALNMVGGTTSTATSAIDTAIPIATTGLYELINVAISELSSLKAKIKTILIAERTALNFLNHASGIATLTNEFVKKAGKTKICCTRKTTPNLRLLKKYAVKSGGGFNHRYNLSDEIMIKENHISAEGNLKNLVQKAIKTRKSITVEIENISQLKQVLGLKFKRILFDNMNIQTLRKCLKLCKNKYETEYSGNATLKNIKQISKTGVNRISVGAITHSAKSFDTTLLFR